MEVSNTKFREKQCFYIRPPIRVRLMNTRKITIDIRIQMLLKIAARPVVCKIYYYQRKHFTVYFKNGPENSS